MKKIVCLFSFMAIMLMTISCYNLLQSKEIETTKPSAEIGSFNSISMMAACDISVGIGDFSDLKIKGDSVLVENLIIENHNGCLVIKEKKGTVIHNGSVNIELSCPSLQTIEMKGAGSVNINGENKSDTVSIEMDGAGSINAERIISKKLTTNANGTGSIKLDNVTADDISLNMNGVGSMNATFTSSGKVDCSINGVGSVNLKGHVKSIHKKTNGVGQINTNELEVDE